MKCILADKKTEVPRTSQFSQSQSQWQGCDLKFHLTSKTDAASHGK